MPPAKASDGRWRDAPGAGPAATFVMGGYANSRATNAVLYAIAGGVTVLDLMLLFA